MIILQSSQKVNAIWSNAHYPFDLNSESSRLCCSKSISIATIISSDTLKTEHFSHNHAFYEFCIPIEPIPFIVINGIVYFGEIGWVFPFPSGTEHGLKYDIPMAMQNNIAVDKDYFESLLREKGSKTPFPAVPFRATEELKIYLNAFAKEFSKGSEKDNHKLRHLTALICDELIDESKLAAEEKKEKSGYQRGIHSAAEFMNNNYDKPVSLSDMAKLCGFSRNYFTACFKRVLGETPLEYLTKLRIAKAQQLLKTSSDKVYDIALSCGYTQLNTFTQAFRKATGMNPTEYREKTGS